jgi:NADPH:quinone reductase-like Zn-dependent oxidoreductase
MLVSMARATGASVWGQTGDASKAAWVRERGAEEVVVGDDEAVREAAKDWRPTVVFDPLGDGFFAAAVEVLSDKGRLVAFGTSAGASGEVPLQALYRKGLTVKGYGGLTEPDRAIADAITAALEALADERIEVVVDTVVGLEDLNEAFDLLASRKILGKLVLDLGS